MGRMIRPTNLSLRTVRGPLLPVVLLAVLVPAACSGDDDATPENTEPTVLAPSVPDDSGAPSDSPPSDSPVVTDPVEFEQPAIPVPPPDMVSTIGLDGEEVEAISLPVDLLAQVRRGVEAGSFSQAEGIARALDGVSGRTEPTDGLGLDDVMEAGLTGLTRQAADLIRGGELSADDADLLQASLAIYSPSQDLLDRISEPAPGSGVSGFANASFVTASAAGPIDIVGLDCIDILANGISDDSDLDTGGACFYFVEAMIGGNQLRVYYPTAWEDDEGRRALVETALDGLATSVVVYGELATVGDINAVFSLTDSGTALAQQSYFDDGAPCPITLFPAASEEATESFLQTVAHETFHCVQDWSYETEPYDTHKWWLEGSAEYFSNVVYPAANDEHAWTSTFDVNSLTNDPTGMSYENTVFFQYFANVEGATGVIDLLESVSSAGATLDSLASVDRMDEIWQDFVTAFVVDAVFDPGGGTVGGGVSFDSAFTIDREQTIDYDTMPMRATRHRTRYVKGTHFEQNTNDATLYAVADRREFDDINAWTKMPVDVRPTCEDPISYIVVVTTVDEPRTLLTEVTNAEDAVCDPCLLGTWGLQLQTFADYIVTLISSEGAAIPNLELRIDGSYEFEFTADGTLRTDRDLRVKPIVAGLGAPETTITGTENGRYDSDGGRLTVSGLQGDSTADVGGVSASVFNGPDGASTSYTCDSSVLTMTGLPYGPLVLDLINPPPEPPPVLIQTGG